MTRRIQVGVPNGDDYPVDVTVVAECYDREYEYLLDKSGTLYRRSLILNMASEHGWEVTNGSQIGKPTYNAREYPL